MPVVPQLVVHFTIVLPELVAVKVHPVHHVAVNPLQRYGELFRATESLFLVCLLHEPRERVYPPVRDEVRLVEY
jgi:hypothetical protein